MRATKNSLHAGGGATDCTDLPAYDSRLHQSGLQGARAMYLHTEHDTLYTTQERTPFDDNYLVGSATIPLRSEPKSEASAA